MCIFSYYSSRNYYPPRRLHVEMRRLPHTWRAGGLSSSPDLEMKRSRFISALPLFSLDSLKNWMEWIKAATARELKLNFSAGEHARAMRARFIFQKPDRGRSCVMSACVGESIFCFLASQRPVQCTMMFPSFIAAYAYRLAVALFSFS